MKRMKFKYWTAILIVFTAIVIAGSVILFNNGSEVSGNIVGSNDTETGGKQVAISGKSLNGTDDELIYCIASVSKMYSTAAVMQLVDEGKVKLDGYVTEYLPDFKMADERYKDITVRMLMNHTSGIMGTTRNIMNIIKTIS